MTTKASETVTPEQAYDEVCRLAREHALIWQAHGGVVVIVHPDTQKAEGLYEQIQWVHGSDRIRVHRSRRNRMADFDVTRANETTYGSAYAYGGDFEVHPAGTAVEIERLRAELADAVKAIDLLHDERRECMANAGRAHINQASSGSATEQYALPPLTQQE